jgi:EpsD family peptidyl-prolyl cis-trans isomerase
MTRTLRLSAVAIACAALAACSGGKTEKPTGPDAAPVATLNGETITLADLKAEEGQAPPPTNAAAAAALHRDALQNIISRELMARAAEAEKVDQTDGFKRDSKWAVDGVKAAALAKQVMSKAPQPSAAEINKFIADNPRAFAERKFLVVDQLQVMGPTPALQPPPETLDAFAAALDAAKTPYQRRLDVVDSGAVDPGLLKTMMALPPNAVFQVNNGRSVMINQIREVRPTPLSGTAAETIARSYLANQAAIAASKDYVDGLRKDPKTKITYEAGYEPASK